MLVARSAQGVQARPLRVVELRPDGDYHFAVSLAAPRPEIGGEAGVVFQGRNRFAAVYGQARLVPDRVLLERRWTDEWRKWFPGGISDPELALLCVEAHHGEYLDYSGDPPFRREWQSVRGLSRQTEGLPRTRW